MKILKNYRPNGLKITLNDDSIITLMALKHNPMVGIIARVKEHNRVILWDDNDVNTHINDSEDELIAQLKSKF